MPEIIPTAEPFLFPGSRTGCLLIHGYTGAPKEMRWMGEYLAARGYSVLGIRLTGHATRIQDMRRSHWTDWVASVEDGYHLLCGLADRIYLVGLSMGGALSLLMSTRLHVNGVVAISTPYRLSIGPAANLVWLVGKFVPYAPKSREAPGSGWFDKQAGKEHISYDRTPVASVTELTRLLAAMRRALPHVGVPVLLIHSEDDRFVVPDNVDHIFEALPDSIDKTRVLVKNSGHVVTRDAAREKAFAATAQFILRLESAAK
ncbi:MAG TPA: alpha/beta fold hydrolase [Anaerolineales bacterium]